MDIQLLPIVDIPDGTHYFIAIQGPEWAVLQQDVFIEYIVHALNVKHGKDRHDAGDGRFFETDQFFAVNGRPSRFGAHKIQVLVADMRYFEGPFKRGAIHSVQVYVSDEGIHCECRHTAGEENVRPRLKLLRDEIKGLIEFLSLQPDALPRLANLSGSQIDIIKAHFREIKKWSEIYSWRSIPQGDLDAIQRLIESTNGAEREEGERRARVIMKEKLGRDALHEVYINQYADFLRHYGFLGDAYAGPRAACTIT